MYTKKHQFERAWLWNISLLLALIQREAADNVAQSSSAATLMICIVGAAATEGLQDT